MDTRQLEAFIILSECLSVTRTAERLFCTQPAISISIKKLEDSLNTKLFERTDNRLRLTPQGAAYREYALHITSLLKQSREHMRLFDNPEAGSISIGASHFCGAWLLPQAISKFNQRYPRINIRLEIEKTTQLIKKLDAHDVDFIIISDYINISPQKNILLHLTDDPFTLICHPNHAFAKKEKVLPEELINERFLIKPEKSASRIFMENSLFLIGIQPEQLMEINNLESIKQCVINGLGVSIVPRRSVLQEIKHGFVSEVLLDGLSLSRGINCVQHKDKLHSPAVKLFLSEFSFD